MELSVKVLKTNGVVSSMRLKAPRYKIKINGKFRGWYMTHKSAKADAMKQIATIQGRD